MPFITECVEMSNETKRKKYWNNLFISDQELALKLPTKFERFQRPIKNDRTEENSTAKYDGKHYFRCPFSRFIDIRSSGILRIFFNVSKEGFLEAWVQYTQINFK